MDADVASDAVPSENIRFIFGLLDDIGKRIAMKTRTSNDGQGSLSVLEIQNMVNDRVKIKTFQFSNHGQRLTHFILYLNTKLENCSWVKDDPLLNLKRYVHGNAISRNMYYKVVDILNLKPFSTETIMNTPYCFCRDLVDISLNIIMAMDGLSQLTATEELIIALFKCIKRSHVTSDLETALMEHFNRAMLVFGKDNLPHDIRRLDFEDDQKEILKYNGFRVKSIFHILVEIIRFKSTPDNYRQYPMYKLKAIRNTDVRRDVENHVFKKCLDVIMYKCMDMCDFSVDTWLYWYEIEVVEEDTNLQSCIGHLCYELCTFIDNRSIDEEYLKKYKPILDNLAIKKIDYSKVDISDINGMIGHIENSPRYHINGYIKKMIENPNVFSEKNALQTLDNNMDSIDYNCFRSIVDHFMHYYKNGGKVFEFQGSVLYKGILHLDMNDKMSILEHVLINYPDNSLNLTSDFDDTMCYIARNENNEKIDQKELMSKLIWITIQQPKKVLHILISQYVSSVYGLQTKAVEASKTCLFKVLIYIHVHMDPSYIYEEYSSWLDFKTRLTEDQKQNLQRWILGCTRMLSLVKSKLFLANVITPLLSPSLNYHHMVYLINLIKYFLTECQLMTLPNISICDKLLINLGNILDDARWTIENFSPTRVELCEKIIMTIQPLLHFASYNMIRPDELGVVKEKLSVLHLMTRSHFLRLWTTEYITVDGMDEQFIMTIQSQSHISYSNLNRSSTQKAQEEFIFSIATYMPKFTLYELKSFVANYLSSAKNTNIADASFFLLECTMNAFMRIIVYLKTNGQDNSDSECAWDYLENTIINFLDVANTSRMCCIYEGENDVDMALSSICKIIMVIKQLENIRQVPLLVVVRRIIEVIMGQLNAESITKLLTLIASMKTKNCKDTLRSTAEVLMRKLKTLNKK